MMRHSLLLVVAEVSAATRCLFKVLATIYNVGCVFTRRLDPPATSNTAQTLLFSFLLFFLLV